MRILAAEGQPCYKTHLLRSVLVWFRTGLAKQVCVCVSCFVDIAALNNYQQKSCPHLKTNMDTLSTSA